MIIRSPKIISSDRQPSDLANLYAFYQGGAGIFDATSGGNAVTADAASVKRWEDQSGNGRHVTQGTAGKFPIFDAVKGLVVSACPNDQRFAFPASFQLATQNFTAIFICELTNLRWAMNGTGETEYHFFTEAAGDVLNLHYDGAAGVLAAYDGSFHQSTTIPYTTGRVMIAFVGTATGLKCWLNGSYSQATAMAAATATLTDLFGANSSVSPIQAGFKDAIFYNRALTDSEMLNTILPYTSARGVPSAYVGQSVFDGDSITQGYGATVNRSWVSRLSLVPAPRIRNMANTGIQLSTLAATAAARIDPLLIAGETNVLNILAGTNDIQNGATGVATYNALVSYCQARRAAGWNRILVYTMMPRSSFDATMNGYRDTFNASVLANWATFADVLVDVSGVPANFDGIHPDDAGHAAIAAIANPKINAALV